MIVVLPTAFRRLGSLSLGTQRATQSLRVVHYVPVACFHCLYRYELPVPCAGLLYRYTLYRTSPTLVCDRVCRVSLRNFGLPGYFIENGARRGGANHSKGPTWLGVALDAGEQKGSDIVPDPRPSRLGGPDLCTPVRI